MPENKFWAEASLLLNTSCIKKLSISDSKKLLSILANSNLEKPHLESFIKDDERSIDIKNLKLEVKKSKKYNLTTLLSQIVK